MTRKAIAAIILSLAFPVATLAVEARYELKVAATAGATPMTEGEIRKVDKDAKKLTIRHGPIANLDMPAMTMVFQVKDPAMLDQVKAGDKIKFTADKAGGAYTITQMEVTK